MKPGDGEYAYDDIIGLAVVSVNGENIGHVSAIMKTGANDVFFVRRDEENDDEVLIPAIKQVIKDIDLETGVITVELLPGLI